MINNFLEIKQYNKEINNCTIGVECKSKIDTTIDFEYSQFSKSLEAISESDFYKKRTPGLSNQHKIGHIQKVMLFAQIIAQNENLNENQTKILLASASFHDSGRTKDRDNGEHGISSAEIAGEYFKENHNNPYGITQDEIGIVQVVIEYHVINECIPGQIDESKLHQIFYKYDVNPEKFEQTKKISAILKDADALDRTRFISGSSLNSKFLRMKTAKNQSMIEFSKKINQEYASYVLFKNYPIEQWGDNDKVKALQFARYDYRSKNGGTHKKERDIPVEIVKSIFKNVLDDRKTKIEEYVAENTFYNKSEIDEIEL